MTLAWDANTEPDLAGYIVHYGAASGSYTNAIDVGNVTTATTSNLVQGCTYYFVVTAYNTSGLESDPSNEVTYQVPTSGGGPVNPVITWTTPANQIYGTVLSSAQLNATADVAGTFAYSPPAGTVLPAGNGRTLTAIFTPADTINYLICTNTVSATVLPAPLTITANNQAKAYGAALPTLTPSYAGFVNSDAAASLTTPVSLTTAAAAGSPVGSYAITASGATSPNYAISFVNGTLTVAKAVLTITANDQAKPFGAALPNLTASYAGFINGDTAASLATPVSLTTTATAASPVGTYAIMASGATSPNYTVSFANGTLTVTAGATSGTFANAATIRINDVSPATPYPSTITVAGLAGAVSKITVTLNALSHTWPADMGILLVGPSGQKVPLLANVGGGKKLSNITLTLDDAAASSLPSNSAITNGAYRPTSLGQGKAYPAPAPASPYGTALTVFNGSNPNGTWSLYVVDDSKSDTGTILNGWSLAISTQVAAPGTFANTSLIGIASIGPALVYPSTVNVGGLAGTVSLLSVTLNNLSHTWPKDIGALLVGPTGQKVVLLANVGGGKKIANVTLTLDDTAATSLPVNAVITSGTYKPTNAGAGKVYPAPAPAGPYATTLAAFNGTNPNGTWSLFIVDDSAGDSGTLAGGWTLNLITSAGLMAAAHQAGDGNTAVTPPPVAPTVVPAVIHSAQPMADGQFQINFTAQVGQVYTVQASANHRDWMRVGSVQAVSDTASFVDTEASSYPRRFYRVVQSVSSSVVNR